MTKAEKERGNYTIALEKLQRLTVELESYDIEDLAHVTWSDWEELKMYIERANRKIDTMLDEMVKE